MCFSDRKKPVCCILILSALAAICGIIMIAFAFMFTNKDVLKQMEKENSDIEDGRKLVFIGLVIFSLLTMVVASLGFCTKCCKSIIFYVCYGTLLLPVWIIVIVIGAAALFVSIAAEDKVTEECEKLLAKASEELDKQIGDKVRDELSADTGGSTLPSGGSGGGSFRDQFATQFETCKSYTSADAITINLDIYTQIGINEFMCSSDCKCKDVPKKTDWTKLTEVENRDMPCKAWDFTGTVTTYKECITTVPEITVVGEGAAFAIFAKKFREQDDFNTIMEWIEFFEDEYTCAGICTPALFYWSKSIELG